MIRIFSYSRESKRMEIPGIADLPRHLADRGRMIWVDLEDPTDEEAGVLGGMFGFHVLAAEDCIRGDYQPRMDLYDDCMFLVVHAVDFGREEERFTTSEVDIFVGEHYLVTYHDKQVKGIFDTRGQVAKNPGSLLRSPDWLLHGILDAMVDNYTPALQMLEERIETLEERLLGAPGEAHLKEDLTLRREVFHLRRIAVLQQGVLGRLVHDDLSWIAGENRLYFRNVYDHLVRISQTTDLYRERLTGAREVHLSLNSRRTDRAVRTLAVVVAIGMPLTLIAGIYGMNFKEMPGLATGNGFFTVMGTMALLALGMLAVFKKKRWF